MHSAEDLFTEEFDNDQNDLEIINEPEVTEPNDVEEIERDEQSGDENDNEGGDKKTIKPKRVVRNPQPKLNLQTLKTNKGLTAMPALFAKCKFKGRGHEETDLRVLMKTYEYFCHRLFPKCHFDDCVSKLETLGHKKPVRALITKIRMGLMVDEDPVVQDDEDIIDDPVVEPVSDDPFDNLIGRPPAVPAPALSEEQLGRIRLNRENAERLRQERLRKIREHAEASLVSPSQLPVQGNSNEMLELQENHQTAQLETDAETCETNAIIIADLESEEIQDTLAFQRNLVDTDEVQLESCPIDNLKNKCIDRNEADSIQNNMEQCPNVLEMQLNQGEEISIDTKKMEADPVQKNTEQSPNVSEIQFEKGEEISLCTLGTQLNGDSIRKRENNFEIAVLENEAIPTNYDNSMEVDEISFETTEKALDVGKQSMVNNFEEISNITNQNNLKAADLDISKMLAEDDNTFSEALDNASAAIENCKTSIQSKSFYGKKKTNTNNNVGGDNEIGNSAKKNLETMQNELSSQISEGTGIALDDLLNNLGDDTAME